MSMIERVARAICLAELPTDDKWELCVPAARAAIEAFNNPSDEFLEAMHIRAYDGRFAMTGETYPVYRNTIRSFVDAALTQGESE